MQQARFHRHEFPKRRSMFIVLLCSVVTHEPSCVLFFHTGTSPGIPPKKANVKHQHQHQLVAKCSFAPIYPPSCHFPAIPSHNSMHFRPFHHSRQWTNIFIPSFYGHHLFEETLARHALAKQQYIPPSLFKLTSCTIQPNATSGRSHNIHDLQFDRCWGPTRDTRVGVHELVGTGGGLVALRSPL